MLQSFQEYLTKGILGIANDTGIYVNPLGGEVPRDLIRYGILNFMINKKGDVFIFNGMMDHNELIQVLVKQGKYDVAVPIVAAGSVTLNDSKDNYVDIFIYYGNVSYAKNSPGLSRALHRYSLNWW